MSNTKFYRHAPYYDKSSGRQITPIFSCYQMDVGEPEIIPVMALESLSASHLVDQYERFSESLKGSKDERCATPMQERLEDLYKADLAWLQLERVEDRKDPFESCSRSVCGYTVFGPFKKRSVARELLQSLFPDCVLVPGGKDREEVNVVPMGGIVPLEGTFDKRVEFLKGHCPDWFDVDRDQEIAHRVSTRNGNAFLSCSQEIDTFAISFAMSLFPDAEIGYFHNDVPEDYDYSTTDITISPSDTPGKKFLGSHNWY